MTAGWRTLGRLIRDCDVRSLQALSVAQNPPDDEMFRTATADIGVQHATLINCLSLQDPSGSFHLGLSYEVLEGIWGQAKQDVLRLLQPVLRAVRRARVESGRAADATYVFWCKSGKRRSVAMARIVGDILGMMGAEAFPRI